MTYVAVRLEAPDKEVASATGVAAPPRFDPDRTGTRPPRDPAVPAPRARPPRRLFRLSLLVLVAIAVALLVLAALTVRACGCRPAPLPTPQRPATTAQPAPAVNGTPRPPIYTEPATPIEETVGEAFAITLQNHRPVTSAINPGRTVPFVIVVRGAGRQG